METDSQERFHNICRAATGVYRTFGLLFVLLGLLNAQICYQKKTLLCPHGAVILLLLGSALWSAGDFLRWKKQARLSLSRTGTLPSTPWKTVCRKNIAVYCLVLLFVVSMFFATFSRISSDTRIFIIPYLTVYVLLLFVFSWLIHLLREKCAFSKTVNLVIYWGAADGGSDYHHSRSCHLLVCGTMSRKAIKKAPRCRGAFAALHPPNKSPEILPLSHRESPPSPYSQWR